MDRPRRTAGPPASSPGPCSSDVIVQAIEVNVLLAQTRRRRSRTAGPAAGSGRPIPATGTPRWRPGEVDRVVGQGDLPVRRHRHGAEDGHGRDVHVDRADRLRQGRIGHLEQVVSRSRSPSCASGRGAQHSGTPGRPGQRTVDPLRRASNRKMLTFFAEPGQPEVERGRDGSPPRRPAPLSGVTDQSSTVPPGSGVRRAPRAARSWRGPRRRSRSPRRPPVAPGSRAGEAARCSARRAPVPRGRTGRARTGRACSRRRQPARRISSQPRVTASGRLLIC